MLFKIRAASELDATTIRALIHEGRINPTGLNWRRFILAVDAQENVIGCGQIKPHADGSFELASIAVATTWRSKGVARSLIETLLQLQQETLYLTCRASLEPFYNKFGFKSIEYAQMPAYFRRTATAARILTRLKLLPETILVMKRKGQTPVDR